MIPWCAEPGTVAFGRSRYPGGSPPGGSSAGGWGRRGESRRCAFFTPFRGDRNIRCVRAFLFRLALAVVAVPSGVLCLAAVTRREGYVRLLNIPFAIRFWPLYLVCFVVAGGLWLVTMRTADWMVLVRPGLWRERARERHVVTGLVLVKVLIAVAICQAGFLFLSSDDFCRIDVAYRWRERPFFATWDHVWLAGQFYVQGGLMRLIHDPMATVRLSALFFAVIYTLILYRLAREVFDRRTAYVALGLLAVLPYPTWLSVAGHPNPFFMAFALLGTLLLVTSRGRWLHLLGAAAAWCAASSFRYEGILLGGVYAVWTAILVLSDRRRWTAKALTAHVVLCVIPFVYILAWSVSSYRTFGDAFQFFRTARSFNPEWIAGMGTVGRILWYPKVLAGGEIHGEMENHLSAAVFILGLAGMPVSLAMLRSRRGLLARYVFVVVLNMAFLSWSVVRGGGNVMAQRVVVLSQVFLLPFVAAAFWAAWDIGRRLSAKASRRWAGVSLRAAAVAGLAVLMAVELGKTFRFPLKMRGVDAHAVTLADALHQRFLRGDPGPEGVTAVIVDSAAGPEGYWVVGVLGRRFERTLFVGEGWEGKLRAALARRGLFLYISFANPPLPDWGAERLEKKGRYALWQVVDPEPETAMEFLSARLPPD